MQQTWCAIFLPELSLQVAHRGLIKDLPLAISDGPANRPHVLSRNRAARDAGVRRGMPIAAARALCAELIVLPREAAREQAALAQIATALSCFTPNVALGTQCVLLEVAATLKLFGGLPVLVKRVRGTVRALNYIARIAVAATPLAASLFAKDPRRHEGDASERLDTTALALFDWPADVQQSLARLALTRVRDIAALPQDGVIKRFGTQIVTDIDKARGRASDPRVWFAPPAVFSTRIELPAETTDSAMLQVVLRRMLNELEHFLRARGAGADALTVTLEHGSVARTPLQINTREPARAAARWESLARELLAKTALTASVSALSLQVTSWQAQAAVNESWLPERGAQLSAWHSLADRLAARLGASLVYTVAVQDDHRPERAWAEDTQRASRVSAAAFSAAELALTQSLSPLRPLWLLEAPRALLQREGRLQYHGDVQLLAGPERIEAGWWDGAPARRDYFIARNAFGELLWVYRDLVQAEGRWYLQGLFA